MVLMYLQMQVVYQVTNVACFVLVSLFSTHQLKDTHLCGISSHQQSLHCFGEFTLHPSVKKTLIYTLDLKVGSLACSIKYSWVVLVNTTNI